jgi:hypothetical protein
MEEFWENVYYNGEYTKRKISSFGRMILDDGRVAKSADNGAGYLTYPVMSWKEGDLWKSKREYIHRLVATYFIDNPDNLPQVNHKDCDKSNNCVDNLEWISRKCNIDHAHASGRMSKRSEYGSIKLLTVEEVKECYTRVKLGEGVNVVAVSMGKARTTISSIINKRSRSDITDIIDEQLKGKT